MISFSCNHPSVYIYKLNPKAKPEAALQTLVNNLLTKSLSNDLSSLSLRCRHGGTVRDNTARQNNL